MRHPRWPDQLSRLGRFMWLNGVTMRELAERSGLNMRYIGALRYGKASPTLKAMKFIAGAMSDIAGTRVHLGELFDLDFETIDDGRDN
jgi:transcriptional regulator with XRE-family HTH domain